jgi:uncharacterized protein YecT (DUF1311 family)
MPLTARAQTQYEITAREGDAAGKADREMNVAYQKLLSVLTVKQKAVLRRAQRAWLIYQENESDLSAASAEGGSLYATLYLAKKAELTQNRTRELKQDYKMFTV